MGFLFGTPLIHKESNKPSLLEASFSGTPFRVLGHFVEQGFLAEGYIKLKEDMLPYTIWVTSASRPPAPWFSFRLNPNRVPGLDARPNGYEVQLMHHFLQNGAVLKSSVQGVPSPTHPKGPPNRQMPKCQACGFVSNVGIPQNVERFSNTCQNRRTAIPPIFIRWVSFYAKSVQW